MPHACHEEPNCPPCPFLMEKPCACGKKLVGNQRCSLDPKRVSCGTVCGKLLKCGGHRCRKVRFSLFFCTRRRRRRSHADIRRLSPFSQLQSCHPLGECEPCVQICLKPRKLCTHPCPLPCHSPSTCPIDVPCPKMITVTCTCGHLSQTVRCSTSTERPEGNMGRLLKCSDACAVNKRNVALAEALGIEKREKEKEKMREVEYDQATLSFFAGNQVRRRCVPFSSGVRSCDGGKS